MYVKHAYKIYEIFCTHAFYLEQASSQEPTEGSQEEIVYSPLKKIKDEPIDEDYDKALISSAHSDISRVKEELENGDHEVQFVLFCFFSATLCCVITVIRKCNCTKSVC